jgi:hypothetical protein
VLVGYLSWCGSKDCDCWVPVIVDSETNEEQWRGEFKEHPTEAEREALRASLREQCDLLGAKVVTDRTYTVPRFRFIVEGNTEVWMRLLEKDSRVTLLGGKMIEVDAGTETEIARILLGVGCNLIQET